MITSQFRTNKIRPNIVYVGQVIDNIDPEYLGRIRVKIPGVLDFDDTDHYPWCIPDWHHVDGCTQWSGCFDVPKPDAIVGVWFQEGPDTDGSVYHPVYTSSHLMQPQILQDSLHHYPNRKVHRLSNGTHVIVDTEDDSVWMYNPGETHCKSAGKLVIKSEETFVLISDVEVAIRAPEIALRAKDHLIMESDDKLTMRCLGQMNIETRNNLAILAANRIDMEADRGNMILKTRQQNLILHAAKNLMQSAGQNIALTSGQNTSVSAGQGVSIRAIRNVSITSAVGTLSTQSLLPTTIRSSTRVTLRAPIVKLSVG